MIEPNTTESGNDPEANEKEFDLSGGLLCLDFANTESDRHLPTTRDELETYGDLVAWTRQTGVVDDETTAALRSSAGARLKEALSVLARARELRAAIYQVISARVGGSPIDPEHLQALSALVLPLVARSLLAERDFGFELTWAGPADSLDRPLWAVAHSTLDLLTSPDLARVRECSSPTCTWLFVDTSRNHSRRWCDMKSCGNRAKARRHYERHKGE